MNELKEMPAEMADKISQKGAGRVLYRGRSADGVTCLVEIWDRKARRRGPGGEAEAEGEGEAEAEAEAEAESEAESELEFEIEIEAEPGVGVVAGKKSTKKTT